MLQVLQNSKPFIIYAKHFLFFEWALEESDLRQNSSQQSSKFIMEGENSCYLEFKTDKGRGTYLYLHCTKEIASGRYITDICDSSNSHIASTIQRISNILKIDLIPSFVNIIPSSVVYPIIVSCTVKTSKTLQLGPSICRHNSSLKELTSDFKNILNQETDTDITLKVGEEIIKVHKSVLVARSPVFRKMFHHDSCEAADNTVAISDVKSATMRKLVHFLYTAEMQKCGSVDEIMELYYAADKYEVLSLRQECASELVTSISVDNACSLFALANRHNDDEFLKELVPFISENFGDVVNGEAVYELSKDDMKLLMRKIACFLKK